MEPPPHTHTACRPLPHKASPNKTGGVPPDPPTRASCSRSMAWSHAQSKMRSPPEERRPSLRLLWK